MIVIWLLEVMSIILFFKSIDKRNESINKSFKRYTKEGDF